jgi:hypothetical protein
MKWSLKFLGEYLGKELLSTWQGSPGVRIVRARVQANLGGFYFIA